MSADHQVAKEGVALTRLNATLLEKIEELTLYSIQLEKRNQQQENALQRQMQELQTIKQKQSQLEQLIKERLGRK
ncbi:hypothetical protein [Spirosoma sp.]|uniref:hypothetical protein n=1 Tax=Spirosoma sp. TaxID=1899569 RepID=UPI003B3A5BD6